jgi:formate dehydrogenase iron-sulfur subunit
MYAILYDETKCVGCNKCVEACTADNKLPPEIPDPTAEGDGLSGRRWTSIVKIPGADRYAKKQCLHCLEPACQAACLVGAMKKTPEGPVVYDASKCIGCRYCMLACPVGIPRYNWESPLPYIQKCDMCFDRLAQGKLCACVEACPHGALSVGDREAQIEKAHALISFNPGKYIDHVYGERELGGTCVLYITDTPLANVLRLDKSVGNRAIPEITWPVISKTPIIGGTVLLGLVGTYFLFERKKKIAAELAAEKKAIPDKPEEKDQTDE